MVEEMDHQRVRKRGAVSLALKMGAGSQDPRELLESPQKEHRATADAVA